MSFDEVLFPLRLTRATKGGPRRRTEIATLGSGAEERNAVWAGSRREWNAGYAIRNADDLAEIIAFWEARLAQARGFRFRHYADYKSCLPSQTQTPTDQPIGTGNGVLATFQLIKQYSSGGQIYARTISKPVAGTVRVAVAGVEKTLGIDFTVDTTTGIVTFLLGHIPGVGMAITAGFEFDVPARFNTDFINADIAELGNGEIPDIPIIEIKV